jgi:hypothetical protein
MAGSRFPEERESDVMLVMTRPAVFACDFCRRERLLRRRKPVLAPFIKRRFQLFGSGASMVIRGERMENAGPAVALWGPRRYISGSKFP